MFNIFKKKKGDTRKKASDQSVTVFDDHNYYVSESDFFAQKDYYTSLILYDSALNITSNRETKVAIYNNLAYLQYLIGNKQEAMDMYSYMLSLIDENTDIYIYVSAKCSLLVVLVSIILSA